MSQLAWLQAHADAEEKQQREWMDEIDHRQRQAAHHARVQSSPSHPGRAAEADPAAADAAALSSAAFLHDRYHVKSSSSAARQAQTAALSQSYKEVSLRKPPAFTLAVDLHVSTEGRTVQQRPNSDATIKAEARRRAQQDRLAAEFSAVHGPEYGSYATPSLPVVGHARSYSSVSPAPAARPGSASPSGFLSQLYSPPSRPSTARVASPSPPPRGGFPAQARHLAAVHARVDSGLGSTLAPPSFDQRHAWNEQDGSQSARPHRPSGPSPYATRSASYADDDLPSGVGGGGQLYMVRAPSAPAAPATPVSARSKASQQRMLSPSPPTSAAPASSMPLTPTRSPQVMMSSPGGVAVDGSVVPMRATFVASHTPRSGAAHRTPSMDDSELRVSTESAPITPQHRDLFAQALSPPSSSQLQSPPSQSAREYDAESMIHRADLTDPFVNLAHAACCSLLRPSHVPSHLPYVTHLPIEHVLAEVPTDGQQTSRQALRKQAGPPPSRLIDLHLDIATIQAIAARFSGLPCLVLGRQMERRALCGVLIESIQADSSAAYSTVTAAKVRLLDFLVSITSLRRQELWSVINGALPALTLWYVHFDTAAEVVARCAEQGVKARVVHMKKQGAAAPAAADDSDDDEAAKSMVPPPIPFVFYSMHLSALTAYSPKLVWTLASLWREKAQRTNLPNFMFRPEPAELAEKERIREWKAAQRRIAIESGGSITVSHARSHSAQLQAAGWTKPGEFRSPNAAASSPSKPSNHTTPRPGSAVLVPYPPAAIVPAASEAPISSCVGSTSLTPSQLNSLPPRAQKRALRKEILLLLNQKHFMNLKKEELVATKVQLDVAQEELEKEIASMDASNETTQKRLAAEKQALDRRMSAAAEQKVADESSLATARATLAARENSNSVRESSLEAQQKDLASSLAALEAEKKAVLLELERNEQEISRIAAEKQKLAEGESRLESEKKTTQAEREALAAEAAQVREEELRAQAEKARLSEVDRSLKSSLLSLQEQQGMAAIDREIIEKENAAIEAAKQKLLDEKAAMDAAQADNLRAIEAERDAMVAREESIKASVVAEREGVEAALRELREGADKIHLAKNLEEEEAKIARLKDEIEAERQALRAEREANLAALAQDKATLEATRIQMQRDAEAKMLAWEKQKSEEIAQREQEEKERQAALVQERLEKYKMKRTNKLQIGTDPAALGAIGPSPASKLNAQLAAASAASSTTPAPATPAEPVTPLQHKHLAAAAAFEAAAAPKKLILNSDDIASLTPAQKKEFAKSQQSHAEMDEMYRVFLGVTFKSLRKSGPPAIFLLLQISLDKIEKYAVLLGSQPILELHTIRAKTSSVVEESEVGKGESHAFNPMLIDLQRLCALQLERTVLLKVSNASRSEEDPRGYIAETRLNLVEMQSHSVVPLVHMDKAKKDFTGKKLLGDFGRIIIKRAQLMVDSTHGITHFAAPNTRDPSNPSFEKLSQCLLRMEARATGITTAGGLFGPSKDVAPILEFIRKDASSGTFDLKSPPAYRTEITIGTNVTFLPVRVGLFELCYGDINRPILCRLLHDGMGKAEFISEFEFTVATVLASAAGAESEYAAGPADKKTGVRAGKITFHSGRVYSALTDLQRLCECAGLVPSAVVKNKDNADCPPLGLDAVLTENAAAVKQAQAAQTPIAFNNGVGDAPVPLVAGAATAAATRGGGGVGGIGSGHARRPSAGVLSPSGGLGLDSIKSPGGHRKTPSSAGVDKTGTASKKKKKHGDKEPNTPL